MTSSIKDALTFFLPPSRGDFTGDNCRDSGSRVLDGDADARAIDEDMDVVLCPESNDCASSIMGRSERLSSIPAL
jgi:hypothetical protein